MSTATVGQLLQAASNRIDRLDAEILLGHILHQTRAWLFAHVNDKVEAQHAQDLENLVSRRAAGEPCALIRGNQDFWTLTLTVSTATLIPRADTELLVELALELPGDNLVVLDAGTGSGAIAAAVASERPGWQVFASDSSAAALAVAMHNCGPRVPMWQTNWLDPVASDALDIVISNPPYIEEGDPHLDALAFEPRTALTAGADGLDALRTLISEARRVLKSGGTLILEHGWQQGPAVRGLFQAAQYTDIATHHDLAGRERATMAHWYRPPRANRSAQRRG